MFKKSYYCTKYRQMSELNDTRRTDWLYFGISAAVTVALLVYYPAWFWVGLPFALTYLTKALKAL